MAKGSFAWAAALGAVLAGGLALGPSQAQNGHDAAMTALTSQEETTVARRLLMVSIGAQNDGVHDMLDGALEMDEFVMRGWLSSISAMLYAFPSLYRAEPNPYSEEAERADAARVSLALAETWEEFEAFKALSYAAYLKAQEAADARSENMLALVEELEVMCESCHEAYRTEFEYLDFDRLDDLVP